MDLVLAVLKDKTATTLQKSQLENKWYTGIITVKDVENQGTSDKPNIRLTVEVTSPNGSYYFWMSFATSDVARAGQLRKDAKVRVTGRLASVRMVLSNFTNVGPTEWATFVDVSIDEIMDGPV